MGEDYDPQREIPGFPFTLEQLRELTRAQLVVSREIQSEDEKLEALLHPPILAQPVQAKFAGPLESLVYWWTPEIKLVVSLLELALLGLITWRVW